MTVDTAIHWTTKEKCCTSFLLFIRNIIFVVTTTQASLYNHQKITHSVCLRMCIHVCTCTVHLLCIAIKIHDSCSFPRVVEAEFQLHVLNDNNCIALSLLKVVAMGNCFLADCSAL